MSRPKVVMNNGVLLAAIWRTAIRAWDPTFWVERVSLRELVAKLKSARNISIAST